MKSKTLLLLALLILSSCATGTQKVVVLGDLIPLETAVLSVDNATKALIIAQDFRVATIRTVKKTNPERIDTLRPIDKVFKAKWSEARKHLNAWRLLGQGNENYKVSYAQLLHLAIDLANGEQRWGIYHQPTEK